MGKLKSSGANGQADSRCQQFSDLCVLLLQRRSPQIDSFDLAILDSRGETRFLALMSVWQAIRGQWTVLHTKRPAV